MGVAWVGQHVPSWLHRVACGYVLLLSAVSLFSVLQACHVRLGSFIPHDMPICHIPCARSRPTVLPPPATQVYQPLELLLFIAAVCTLGEAFVPQLIAVPKSTVAAVSRSILSVSFIFGTASVVFNLKSRFCKEAAWQSEMAGDITSQRRWEAYDKLGTFVIYAVTFVLGIQALGLEGGWVGRNRVAVDGTKS